MRSAFAIITAIAWGLAPGLVHAQTTDTAAERARLGEDRARIEAERRARAAEARQAAAEADAAGEAESPPPTDPPRVAAPREEAAMPAPLPDPEPARPMATTAPPPTDREQAPAGTADVQADPAEISRTLEQLRELGALKDAGYLTDEEFERLKQRILDRRF